jgi:hypothetical protein
VSYTDLRDFNEEAAFRFGNETARYVVAVEKLGGGTLGKEYGGTWRYIVTKVAEWDTEQDQYRPIEGVEIARGQDFESPMPMSHRRAALVIWEMVILEED